MNRISKFILTFLSFLTIFSSSMAYFAAPKASAQNTNPWYMQRFDQWYVKVYDTNTSPPQEIFGERYTAAQVQWVMYGILSFFLNSNRLTQVMTCAFARTDVDSCLNQNPLFGANPEPAVIANVSPFEAMFPKERTLSGVNYIRNGISDLKLIPEANAQVGFGFSALNPIQNIWRIFRDIMYGFFVIVIIVFAFMIMFRVKLNPQTVISVQSALPKIVLTLIFVTFSYAIAGLLIDLMYVLIGLVALVFAQTGLFVSSNPWLSIFRMLTDGPSNTSPSAGVLGWFVILWGPIQAALAGVVAQISAVSWLDPIVWVLQFFLLAGITVWMFLNVLKIFILLIKAYISILISIIFSPILIGFGALVPSGGFGSWVRGLVTNLLIYPMTGIMLLLAVLLLSGTYSNVRSSIVDGMANNGITDIQDIFSASRNASGFWYPPLTLGTQETAVAWDPLPILWVFSAIGILAMIPKVAEIIKALMSGKPIETAGINEATNAIFASGLGYAAGSGKWLGKQTWGLTGGAAIGATGRGLAERLIIPSAERVAQGERTSRYDRWVSGIAARRGWLQPFDTRPGTAYRPRGTFGPRGRIPRASTNAETPDSNPPPPGNFPDE